MNHHYRRFDEVYRRHGGTLTAHELQVLAAIVNCGSYDAAAHELNLSVSAIKSAIQAVRQKTGAITTAHAAALCYPILVDKLTFASFYKRPEELEDTDW